MSERKPIECRTHGTAYVTYVCSHLAERTNIDWYSAEIDEEHPWPDSWCGLCHQFYEAEGEWNDRSAAAADVKLKLEVSRHGGFRHLTARCTATLTQRRYARRTVRVIADVRLQC